jgi:hypothetical protein
LPRGVYSLGRTFYIRQLGASCVSHAKPDTVPIKNATRFRRRICEPFAPRGSAPIRHTIAESASCHCLAAAGILVEIPISYRGWERRRAGNLLAAPFAKYAKDW